MHTPNGTESMKCRPMNRHPRQPRPGRDRAGVVRGALRLGIRLALSLAVSGFVAWPTAACAVEVEVITKDGRTLKGTHNYISNLAHIDKPMTGGGARVTPILLLDDNLRRTFIPRVRVQEINSSDPDMIFRISDQRVYSGNQQVARVGPILGVTPFDEFGRRSLTMRDGEKEKVFVQAITEISPSWTKVEGVNYRWDMRMATTSIPREILDRILAKEIEKAVPAGGVANPAARKKVIELRKEVARLYIQSERYDDARKQLEKILADFPGADTARDLDPTIRSLRQLSARQKLDELRLRRAAGQYRLAHQTLKAFPTEGVAGEILQAVSDIMGEDTQYLAQRESDLGRFDDLLRRIEDPALQKRIGPVRKEIVSELSYATRGRLASFRRLAGDETSLPGDRLSLAISGWLVGNNDAIENLSVALAMYEVRELVRQYLNEPLDLNRHQLFKKFPSQDAASPKTVAKLITHMKPPGEVPAADPQRPGYYRFEVATLPKEPPVSYAVQLPPEYDPYRRYPTIVTLHGTSTTPDLQIDWWAGPWASQGGMRRGQASRHGYIVVAPIWAAAQQRGYGYSALEHVAVLNCLRDACRRFAVDTDRVYLSGHSAGGEAAWDIGLAHPDLWAGVIPIVGKADRYGAHYWPNGKILPLYCIFGELDGKRLVYSARVLDRYLRYHYPTTVVEYMGRGHEDFFDEIHRLFDWMGRQRRNFFPEEFTCVTMRPWDNYFWWVEFEGLPAGAMVDPAHWPPAKSVRAAKVEAKMSVALRDVPDPENPGKTRKEFKHTVRITTGAKRTTVWFSPEMFKGGTTVHVNGRRGTGHARAIQPDLYLLLEDVRRRADRQHPFWANIEMPTGRMNVVP